MSPSERFASVEEEVSHLFVQRRYGTWTSTDQAALERRMASDTEFARSYRLAEDSAQALQTAADVPEMMRFRELAFAYARRSSAKRWLGPNARLSPRSRGAAGVAASFVALVAVWQLSPWGYKPGQYATGIGEQRILELADHSRVALDAKTRIAIRYTKESRTVELIDGQAQFSVAEDPARPFRVQAGEHMIVALGTVFTVDFTQKKIHVAMVEGRVAVIPSMYADSAFDGKAQDSKTWLSADRGRAIELSVGQELEVDHNGATTVIPKADLEAATAWRNGKVVFRTEQLADAVRRMNRYSRVQIEIADPALANETVSGVFEAGDTQGFIAGVQLALPVVASHRDSDTIRLSLR